MNDLLLSPENKITKNLLKGSFGHVIRINILYLKLKRSFNNSPIQIKIMNIFLFITLIYVFTYVKFNLILSITISLLFFLLLTLINFTIAMLFLFFYILIIFNIYNIRKKSFGKPIDETNLEKNKTPYNCLNNSLVIDSNKLLQDLYGGYFTYSFWIYLNNDNNNEYNWNTYRNKEWKSIFYRGLPIDNNGDLGSLVQFPGFWLTPILNNMVIVFQNGSYVERLEINNIPFNTWMNVSVVVQTKSVSVYINGKLDRALNLYQAITIMNGYNIYISSDANTSLNKNQSGFAGSLSQLTYYNYALSPTQIEDSYNYYKLIIDKYKKKQIKYDYNLPGIITNSDYLNINNLNNIVA